MVQKLVNINTRSSIKMNVNIGKAISTLLEKNHKVSVSGLGTFKVDNGGKAIGKPPYEAVIFDQEVIDDKSLRDYISEEYGISKNKSTRIINVFSSKVLNGVLNYDDVYIQDLGKLYKGDNRALSFLPLETLGHSGELLDTNLEETTEEKIEDIIEEPVKVEEEEVVVTKTESISNIPKEEVVEPIPTTEKTINSSFAETKTKNTFEEKIEVVKEEKPIIIPPKYEEKSGCSYIVIPLLALLAFFLLLALVTKFCFSALDANKTAIDADPDVTEIVDVSNDNGDSDSLDYSETKEDNSNQYEGKTYEEVHDPSKLIMLHELKVNPEECIIITGSFKKNRNVLKMQRNLETLGYKTFTEVNIDGNLTRVGIQFDCQNEDLRDYIHDIRRNIKGAKKAWYLLPRVHVD